MHHCLFELSLTLYTQKIFRYMLIFMRLKQFLVFLTQITYIHLKFNLILTILYYYYYFPTRIKPLLAYSTDCQNSVKEIKYDIQKVSIVQEPKFIYIITNRKATFRKAYRIAFKEIDVNMRNWVGLT